MVSARCDGSTFETKRTRTPLAHQGRSASVAIKPGGVIVHIGLLEAEGGLDVRKMTLQEITFVGTYTYTMADFRDTVAALDAGVLGKLNWIEKRPLAEGASAFRDLLEGRAGAAKIVLMP